MEADGNPKAEALVNVARFLPEMARAQPEKPAVRVTRGRDGDGKILYTELSFAALDRLSDQAAHYLTAREIVRGTRVLLMVRPGLELIALCFALFKIGAVPVVIDPGMGLKSFLRCVRRTEPEALIGIPLAHVVARVARRAFRGVTRRVMVPGGGRFLGMLEGEASNAEFTVAATGARELAAILFTSGSTGPAKGVCYEHGQFEAQVRLIRDFYGIEPGEVDLPMLPVFALFNPAMGMTTVVPEMNPSRPAAVDPAKIVNAILQNEVTNSFGSPVLWKKIGRYCRERSIQLPSLKRILIAGAPVSPEVIRLFEGILVNGEIHTPYGATESLPVSSISGREILEETWELTEKGAGTCVGRLFPDMRAAILPVSEKPRRSMGDESPLPTDRIGEICVRGPVVTRAYDRLPEATAMGKIPGESPDVVWHRMGDLGYVDAKGRLWFCGRAAERVETGERTLYTDCCEAVFNRHPKVFRTALVGLRHAGEVEPAIVVEPESGQFPRNHQSRAIFIAELRELGAEHDHTRDLQRFFFCRRFPVDVRHNAKIHRLKLRDHFEKR